MPNTLTFTIFLILSLGLGKTGNQEIKKTSFYPNPVISYNRDLDQKHTGTIWGRSPGRTYQPTAGSSTQDMRLMGLFRLEYSIHTIGGEPVYQYKFYWEWDNALKSGYPMWTEVNRTYSLMVEELIRYPDLLRKWNSIKPVYVELGVKLGHYYNAGTTIAEIGEMKVIPHIIGTSGEQLHWSRPASCSWSELFPHCNGMNWDYFEGIGMRDQIEKEEYYFGNDIVWPKYAFLFSDELACKTLYNRFESKYIELDDSDFYDYSLDIGIKEIVWPYEAMKAIIEEYKARKVAEKEQKRYEDNSFWDTPENTEQSADDDFWNTPENAVTSQELKNKSDHETYSTGAYYELKQWNNRKSQHLEKVEALKNPFNIIQPIEGKSYNESKMKISGRLHKFLMKEKSKLYIQLNQEKEIEIPYTGDGRINYNIDPKNGNNELLIIVRTDTYELIESIKFEYNFTYNIGNPTIIFQVYPKK